MNSCHFELGVLNGGEHPSYEGNLGIACEEEGGIVVEVESEYGTCTITYAAQEGGEEGVSLANTGEGAEREIEVGFDNAPLTAKYTGGLFKCGVSNESEENSPLSGAIALEGADGEEAVGVFVSGKETEVAPQATTEKASEIGVESATLNGKVNPKGLATTYQFQYVEQAEFEANGYENATAIPASPKEIGSGTSDIAVDETPEGLEPGTTYTFRVVATNEAGTAVGGDQSFLAGSTSEQLEEIPATEFDGSSDSYSRFETLWSKPGWAANKGQNTKWAWGPHSGASTPSGAYYHPALSNDGWGLAVAATLRPAHPSCGCPPLPGNHFSLWLDMQSPSEAEEAGYELRFTRLEAADRYDVELSKWAGGEETELGSKANYTFEEGDSLALVDEGGTVSAFTDSGSGYKQLLSAEDATYEGGKAGLSGTGLNARLQDFKATALTPPTATSEAASEVEQSSATLNREVNPEGLEAEYRFQWATDAEFEAEGYAHETAAKEAGSGTEYVATSDGLEGLEPGITYHFRAVAESEAGTVWGKDRTFKTEATSGPGAVTLIEPFDGSAESLERFESQWSALGWAEGETPEGRDVEEQNKWEPAGWAPADGYPTLNGAFHEATLEDEGGPASLRDRERGLPPLPRAQLLAVVGHGRPLRSRTGWL
jgi:hypothetical protein